MTSEDPLFKRGHKFDDGFGLGYEMTRDMFNGETPMPGMFAPYGGAPQLEIGDRIPGWLGVQLLPRQERGIK